MENTGDRKMESRQGLDTLFQYATEGIIVADDRGVIVRVNPSAEKLFGYGKGEVIGQRIELLMPKRYAEKHVHDREEYTKHPHARKMGQGMDLYARKKDQTEFPVEISLSPFTSEEGNFVIAFIIDITLRKEAEERMKTYSEELERQVKGRTLVLEEAILELEKTKKELRHALEKEREVNEMKSRFVSMASHEFRTPLTTMMSSLSLVSKYAERNDLDNHSRHILKIKKSINNLTDILNDFLSVSKLEEGKVEVDMTELNVREFMDDVIVEMHGMSADHEIVYEHTGKGYFSFDPKLMKNILLNLISNAIKFSPGGEKVTVLSDAGERVLVLTVSDRGIGIPAEDREHLFERFFRGNNVTNIQGTGLGLNIVMRYVELMNGTIEIDSEQNKGTTVTIRIPANHG
jgi:PAS domain S-box-containing protein